jgi:hypothetical protein
VTAALRVATLLSTEPEVPGSVGWDAHLPRIATIVRLRHRDGTAAGVANTHFDHAGDQARLESARRPAAQRPLAGRRRPRPHPGLTRSDRARAWITETATC